MTLEYLELMEDMKKTAEQQPQAAATATESTLPRKVRGTMTIKSGDNMEFRAYRETGSSTQQEIARKGDSKLYRTVGEKKNSLVAHIVLPADTTDPRAEIVEQVERLTAGLQPKAKTRLRGKTLLSDDEVTVVACLKEHTVQVTLNINARQHPDYTSRLLTLMQRVNQCFATNQTSLAQLR